MEMKKAKQKFGKLATLILSLFLIIAACNKDDTPEVDDPNTNPDNPDGIFEDPVVDENETSSVDANLVTQSMLLDNMQILAGEPPSDTSGKQMQVDLKIDSDTIFWTPGVEQRIKFLKPEGTEIKTALLYVPDSDSYIQADFRTDEGSEEISILYFGFDPTSWELPITYQIEISVLDSGGGYLDSFELPVVIEKPFEETESTGKSGLDDDFQWIVNDAQNWYWRYTRDLTLNIYHASFRPQKTPGETQGCCTPQGESDPGGNCNDPAILEYENVFTTKLMKLVLFPDGTLFGREDSVYKNFDVWNSDFCNNIAAYSETYGEGLTFELPLEIYGNHHINGHKMKIQNVSLNETQMGAGPIVEYKLISEHFMVESLVGTPEVPLPDGLGTTKKYYQRAFVIFTANDPDPNEPYYD